MFALDLKYIQSTKKRKYAFPVRSVYLKVILKIGLSIKARNLMKILIWNIQGREKGFLHGYLTRYFLPVISLFPLSSKPPPSLPCFAILEMVHANIALLPFSTMSCFPSRHNWRDTAGRRGVSSWFLRAFSSRFCSSWCPTQPRSSGAHPLMSFSDTLHVPAVLPALQLASQQRYPSEWLPTKFQQHPNGWLPIKFHQCPAGDLPESFSSTPMTAFHKVPIAPQQTAFFFFDIFIGV